MTDLTNDSSSRMRNLIDALPWQSGERAEQSEEAVEIAFLDPDEPDDRMVIAHFEARFTGSEAVKHGIRVLVRNSREPQNILAFTTAEWDAFVLGVNDGEFDLEPEA